MSAGGMTLEQAAARAAEISGRIKPPTPLMPTGTGESIWQGTAVVVCITGVVWGTVIMVRAIRTANAEAVWWNPMTWWVVRAAI